MKTLLHLGLVALVMCGIYEGGWMPDDFVSLILLAFFVWLLLKILIFDGMNSKEDKKKEQERIESERRYHEDKRDKLISLIGAPVTKIVDCGPGKFVIVSEESAKIGIYENVYDFSQILNCDLIDDTERVISSMVKREGHDTGSVIGRTVVGKLFLGNAGAIVGGLTADKAATTSEQTIKDVHNYTVKIEIDSLSTPVIHIPVGDNAILADELYALLKVISNKRTR